MPAGDSAGTESRRQLALADAHEQAAAEARAAAARFGIAEVTEKQTARTLTPLTPMGYHFLADRRWPGTRRAQVDLIVIGPGGLFIVDTKAWREVSVHDGRVFRGEAEVTDELLGLADLIEVTQADLAEVGLAPGEVHALAVLAGRKDTNAEVAGVQIVGERDALRAIASRGSRLTPNQVELVLKRALDLFPMLNAPAPVVATVPEPVVPAPRETDQDALLSPEEIDEALLSGILARPVEEWMSFLHPQQAKLVRRTFAGPSRIRGAAGTGKTVVGLHRAAHLARIKPGRVLVTTYIRTLPAVLRELLGRLSPETVDRVDFIGVHAFAKQLLSERGVRCRIDVRGCDQAFDDAWKRVGAGSALEAGIKDRSYWSEEIAHVIKGRGITRFEEYADLPRLGRRYPLQLAARRQVWDLYQAYDAGLRERGINDWADLILLAEAELRREPLADGYSAVIVDEAQDLSCAMVRMLHQLVGDGPDGLTLIGDGQQTIYPGGYTLAEAGVSVRSRGVVLDINYRNTAEIVRFAQRLVADDEFADIEGPTAHGDSIASIPRTGSEPLISRHRYRSEVEAALVQRVQAVTRDIGTQIGDVGVLCLTRRGADQAERALAKAGLPVVRLEIYNGVPVEAVKVGTIKRAKGLEFKQVLIPDIRDAHTKSEPPENEAERERWDLTRRELYVAMTRARDGLWVGIT